MSAKENQVAWTVVEPDGTVVVFESRVDADWWVSSKGGEMTPQVIFNEGAKERWS